MERFRESHPDTELTLRWRAFELDPGAPPEPQELRPVIDKKYGPGAFDNMTGRLIELGAADGIEYRFDIAQRVNTFDAHRLVAWSATLDDDHAIQDVFVNAVFDAYFTRGADVSDHSTLSAIAASVGLDADVAAEILASGAYADEVRTDETGARDRDLTGVPAVVIDNRLLVPGAQDVDTFLRVLEKAASTV